MISPHRGLPAAGAAGSGGVGIADHGFSNHVANLNMLLEGVQKLADKIGVAGRLEAKLGSPDYIVHWVRRASGLLCNFLVPNPYACTMGTYIEFYDSLFKGDPTKDEYISRVRGTAVHELAHAIQFVVCLEVPPVLCNELLTVSEESRTKRYIREYAGRNHLEYWAEAVTDWVFGHTAPDGYKAAEAGRQPINGTMEGLIRKVFGLPPLPP